LHARLYLENALTAATLRDPVVPFPPPLPYRWQNRTSLDASVPRALAAWAAAGFDEALGSLLGVKLGPTRIRVDACDPEIVAQHPGA